MEIFSSESTIQQSD